MSSALTHEEIARDAQWLAQAVDPSAGVARLVAMDRESYRAASFLDDRMLQTRVDAQVVSWTAIEEAITAELRSDARWIFHIGHVGSTLVSRMLGEIDGVLAVREPRLLRDVALIPGDIRQRYAAPVARLMSRTFDDSEVACVKATSFASEVASALVPPGERALFMFATPRNYVASILAGENSIAELRALAGTRGQRLSARGLSFTARNEAELAAAAWATEMTSLQAAAEGMPDRQIAWTDFDTMLGNVGVKLARMASFFGFNASADRMRAITSGPLLTRYSKAPEHAYSPMLRRDIIAESSERHRRDIDSALAMLETAAEKSPLLARALARAREG